MKTTYTAPALTVVTFRTERGYSISGTPEGTPRDGFLELMLMDNNNGYQETEVFSQHSTWTQESSSSFWN